MVELKTVGISVLAVLLGSLLFYGGATLFSENAYYCAEKNIISNCDRLSSTLKTCYFKVDGINKQLTCTGTWAKVTNDIKIEPVIVLKDNFQYSCSVEKCVPK